MTELQAAKRSQYLYIIYCCKITLYSTSTYINGLLSTNLNHSYVSNNIECMCVLCNCICVWRCVYAHTQPKFIENEAKTKFHIINIEYFSDGFSPRITTLIHTSFWKLYLANRWRVLWGGGGQRWLISELADHTSINGVLCINALMY